VFEQACRVNKGFSANFGTLIGNEGFSMKVRLIVSAVAAALCVAGPAQAVDNINFNGFLTVGATMTDSDVPYFNGNMTDEIGFEQDSRVGLQISADINEQIGVTAQLLGRARDEDYDAFFDWGFLSYAVNENVTVRGGKLKFPTYLISDYFEVGYAYPWIRPPQEVYYSNPLTAISGVDVLWRAPVGSADLLIQPYVGTSRGQETLVPQWALEVDNMAGDPFSLPDPGSIAFVDFEAENLVGINTSLTWSGFSVRAGYLTTDVKAQDIGVIDADTADFWSVGATVDWNNIVSYAEYFEREIDGIANLGFPNQKGYYVTLGYRLGKFLPHITYAQLENNDNPTGSCGVVGVNPVPCGEPLEQDSITLGLRYELSTGAALKIEAQQMNTDNQRGLFTGYVVSPNGNVRTNPGDVNIFSVAVDVVF
jgi:predicted porin